MSIFLQNLILCCKQEDVVVPSLSKFFFMKRAILETTSGKIKSFIKIANNGLDKHLWQSGFDSAEVKRKSLKQFQHKPNKLMEFDWENFSNELEFE